MPHLSEKFLLSRLGVKNAPGVKINEDRTCPGCGYNLRGLNEGRRCPECGAPIRRAGQSGLVDDLLGTGDHDMRRRWQIGLALGALCLVVVVAGRWISLMTAAFVSGKPSPVYYIAILLNSGLWLAAVWMMTPPQVDQVGGYMKWLRRFVRGTQCLWPFALTLLAYARLANMPQALEDRLMTYQWELRFVAGIGVIALAWLLLVVAEGAGLDKAPRRLLVAVWIMPLLALLAAVFPNELAWFMLVLLWLVLFFWSWTMALFALAMHEMQAHAGWSIRYMHDQTSRQERIAERRQEMDEEVADRVRPTTPEAGSDVPLGS